MAAQGIQLPISLQINNLQEIANQMKQFANKNVLADSFGGKKLDSELNKILTRLDQISAKSRTAFTTQGDFTSVQKDINSVELSLNKVQDTIKNLGFSDLKIPSEFSGQIAALQGRIKELNGSLAAFKGTQKERLISNADFMADLQAADPRSAAKWLEKGYDELQAAINDGMTRVNTTLALKTAEYESKQKILTQGNGKTSMTQWGALEFIEQAFKTLPNDKSQRSSAQEWISQYMREAENGKEFSGFNKGAVGMNGFLKSIKEKFSFSDEQMAEMKARIKQQVQALREAGETEATSATVVKKMGSNSSFAKQILFGDGATDIELAAKKYANDIKDAQRLLEEKTQLQSRSEAFGRIKIAFDIPNEEIKQKTAEIAAALRVPEEALKGFEASILSAATRSPELTAMFQRATGEIATLTSAVEQGKSKLQSIDNTINKMQGISNFINRYIGLYAIVRKVTTAIRNAFNNIKDLDKAITSIAVVTNMSQEELWGKIGEYTQMAQQYGVATRDVYEVSQIFYQQGLQTSQVMSMTTESLKMAKIAGIDYTTAANAMTVAVRAFKLEMSEAQSVTDTYSALAAKFAVSSSEIANAMEKTASSAASVGMSLQSTSAFISVMEQTTRESAQNIGSALKSIISRYGEMKASPATLLNVDGEEVAFNKVDTALKSIGISIKDASGQFRDFDDVIMELASKWNSLDNNTQRYIATIMAGNRQQSRFIALVSNYDELSRAMSVANNSENASIVQVAKTMDSLESKANQVKNAFSQLYLDLHVEEGLKNVYDWLTRILKTIGNLGTLKGVIPTLMNIIGFGAGAKSLIGSGMNWLQDQKGKLEIQTEEAKQKIEEVRANASKDIITKWQIQTDLSQLEAAQTQIQNNVSMASANFSNAMLSANPNLTTRGINNQEIIATATKLYQEGRLQTVDDRAYFMKGYDIEPNSEQGATIDALLQSFTTLKGQADSLGTTLEQVKNAGHQAQTGLEQVNIAGNNEVSASAQVTSTKLAEAQENLHNARIAMNLADAKVREMTATDEATRDKILSAQAVAHSDYDKALAALKAVEGAEQEKGARNRNTGELDRNTGALRGNTNRQITGNTDTKQGVSWKNNEWGNKNAMKIAGIASSLIRMAGTAIVAFGAQHQDKSTDSIETSKLLTGIGNGASMAGMGASMGMSLGPWGAVAGAIGGLLIGGLGPVIDGLSLTLSEEIDLLKQETETAKNESLKAQAKVIDTESTIENLNTLSKSMYESEENMQSYKDAMNNLAEQYPQLIMAYDESGNAIIDLNKAEVELAAARLQGVQAAEDAALMEAQYQEKRAMGYLSGGASARNILNQNLDKDKTSIVDISEVNNTLSEYKDLYGGKNAWQLLYGMNTTKSGNQMTIQELEELSNILDNMTDKAYNASASLDKIAGNSITRRGLFEAIEKSNLDSTAINNLESQGIYSQLFNQLMTDRMGSEFSIYHASKYTPELLETELTNAATDFVAWYQNGLTSVQREILESIDFTQYKSVDEILNKTGIILDLNDEFQNNIYQALVKQFNISNLSGKNRMRSTLYGTTDVGQYIYNHKLNSSLEGLSSLNRNNEIYEIMKLFDTNQIISQYADMFTNELVNINKLATNNQSASAQARLSNLVNLADILKTYDSSISVALENIINKVDFSNYDTIVTAINSIKAYGKNNGINVDSLVTMFESALENLTFNVNTIAVSIMEDIGKVANEVDKIISTNKSGLDLTNALKEFETLQLTLESGNNLKFNDIFQYDAILGKYVYTSNGLVQAINTQEKQLNNKIVQLTSEYDIYKKQIQPSITSVKNARVGQQKYSIENKQQLYDQIDINFGEFEGQLDLYKILADRFIKLYGNSENATWDSFLKFIQSQSNILSEIPSNLESSDFDTIYDQDNSSELKEKMLDEFDDYVANIELYNALADSFLQDESELYLTKNWNTFLEYLQNSRDKMLEIVQNAETSGNEIFDSKNIQVLYDKMAVNFDNYNDNQTQYQELARNFLSDSSDKFANKTWDNFLLYIEEYIKLLNDKVDQSLIEQQEYTNNKKNQYFSAIDWTKLALGTDYSNTNQTLMEELAKSLGMANTDWRSGKFISWKTGKQLDWTSVINAQIDSIYGTDGAIAQIQDEVVRQQKVDAKTAAKAAIMNQIKSARASQINTTITEILNGEGQILSDTSLALIQEATRDYGIIVNEETGVLTAGNNFINSAIQLYKKYSNSLNTLAEKNTTFSSIITKQYSQSNQAITAISSGASMDIDTLSTTFTTFGLKLSDYFDAQTGKWINNLDGALKTDQFGKTIIKDWSKFISEVSLRSGFDITSLNGTYEYANAYSSYVDGLITLDTRATDLIKKNYDNAFSSITGWRPVNIALLAQHQELKEYLISDQAATIEDGKLVIQDTNKYAQNVVNLIKVLSTLSTQDLYEKTGWTPEDLAKNWKNAQTVITQVGDSWIGIAESISSLSTDNISTLVEKGDFKLSELNNEVFTKIGDNYVLTLEQYRTYLENNIGTENGNITNQQKKISEAYNKAEQALINKIIGLDWKKILDGSATASERDIFTLTLQQSLASFGIALSDNNGVINLSDAIDQLKALNTEASKVIVENIENNIAEVRQDILTNISNASSYVTSGSNNLADIQKFIAQYNKLDPAATIDISAFKYDTNLQQFTLSSNILKRYIDAQKKVLENIGLSGKALDAYVFDQTSRLLQQNMDITSILDGIETQDQQQAISTLKTTIQDYLNLGNKVYQNVEQASIIKEQIANLEEQESLSVSAEEASNYQRQIEELQSQLGEMSAESIIKTLYNGGEAAVNVLQQLKGKEVTSDEIAAVYNANLNRITAAEEALESGVGTILSGLAAEIAKTSDGIETQELPNGNVVITQVTNMVDVYAKLYAQMSASSAKTVTGLNTLYAKALTAADASRTEALETLENAAGMAYEDFGNILSKYGILLADAMADPQTWGIQSTGFGQIRITDFNKFVQQMNTNNANWNINSPEYAEAYHSWVDSMIELQKQPQTMMENMAEELNALTTAKVGSKSNVSYLDKAFKELNLTGLIDKDLAVIVSNYKGQLENGILTITQETDVEGMIAEIAKVAQESGMLLPEQLAALADAVSSLLTNITQLITNGISGSLNNVDAQQLQSWATKVTNGKLKLDFQQTAEGLKLSVDSAKKLYTTMKNIDTLQAQVIFEELYNNLTTSMDEFQSASATMNYIADLRTKISQTDTYSTEKINQYKEELSLAEEIAQVRATTEDSSYNFMDNEIPAAQNNPINYLSNWSEAFETIKNTTTGTNKNKIDYTDFYNIITEMGNLAESTGQIRLDADTVLTNSQDAADLITKAAGALSVASDGSVKVDLSKIGVDFSTGASNLKADVNAGIQDVAQSQIDMLDSLIQLLEVIVAMEDLGDIDVKGNGIDLTDIFHITYNEETGEIETVEFTQKYADWRNTIKAKITEGNENFDKDLADATSKIKINGTTLAQMINWDTTDWASAGEQVMNSYAEVLKAFYIASLSGDYNLDDIATSVKTILAESGLTNITVDVGDTTIVFTSNGTTQIDWTNDITKEIVADAENAAKQQGIDAQTAVSNAVIAYSNGQTLTAQELEWVLRLNSHITIDKNGNKTITYNNHTYTNNGNDNSGYLAALTAWRLSDAGITLTDEEFKDLQQKAEGSSTPPTYTYEKTIGVDTKIKVESNGLTVNFYSKTGNKYGSESEMLTEEYKIAQENGYTESEKVWQWKEYKIRESIEAKVTVDNTQVSLTTDAKAREVVQSLKDKEQEELNQILEETGTGNYTYTSADGITVTIPGDSITVQVDGKDQVDKTKFDATIDSMLNVDYDLAETITVGIQGAFDSEIKVEANNENALKALEDVKTKISEIDKEITIAIKDSPSIETLAEKVRQLNLALKTLGELKNQAITITENPVLSTIKDTLAGINTELRNIAQNSTQNITINENTVKTTSEDTSSSTSGTATWKSGTATWKSGGTLGGSSSGATGTIGYAKAQGTLMGELGPELVVSNGKYFVAGQNGAEFVDLADDAIVFNHLQTEQLLRNGASTTRGKAITNEYNAISFAKGNINGGIAMASASAALAALKQLKAQWESLLNLSSSDLSNLGGSGSGGGGSDDSAVARSSYLADVERWYNWLQKIAVLEEKINTEEAKRSKYQADMVARGAEYAKSNLQTLKDLQSEAVTYQALANTQQEFFNLRRSQLNGSAFSRFYTFDENGQLKYNDNDLGYKFLAELMARDDYGEAKYSAEQQYNMLVGAGMEAYMKYDSSGKEILMDEDSEDQSSFYSSSVQAFWDLVDSQKEEMQSLHDSIVEYGDSVIEKQTAAYEIMKEIEDNQISVEDKVYNALVDLRQRAIDELQNQRDAIEKASNNLINGLTEQLNKEKDMYSQTESTNELYSLQRQLAVLQRSGGAASAIASLQKEIASKQQDMYYDAQQRQIDALQEASDNELAKLDEEISLMTETLEYEKEHGFLWQEIADIMRGSPEDIATYIFQNDSQFWGDSPTKQTQTYREALFEAQQFVEYRDSITDGIDGLAQQFSDYVISQKAQEEAANKSTSTGSSGSGGGGGSGDGSDEGSSGSGSSSSSNSAGTSTTTPKSNATTWKYDDNVSGRMYEVDSSGKKTGAIKYDDTGLVNINTTAGQKALEAARNRVIQSEQKKIESAKTILSLPVSTAAQVTAVKQISNSTSTISNLKKLVSAKASGGYVSHGIYELGEQGTETVLTAQQTKILRDNILSSRPNSLLSLLKSYNESYDGITDSTKSITPVEDNSVTIEQAVVEMHVSKIANDYDAQRAGEQALEKMLTIARKTSAQNRIGR